MADGYLNSMSIGEGDDAKEYEIQDAGARDLIDQVNALIATLQDKEKELDDAIASANSAIATAQAQITTNANAITTINNDLSDLQDLTTPYYNTSSVDELISKMNSLKTRGTIWVYLGSSLLSELTNGALSGSDMKGYGTKVGSNWFDLFLVRAGGTYLYTVRYNAGTVTYYAYSGTAL